jgi:hypothetical protein
MLAHSRLHSMKCANAYRTLQKSSEANSFCAKYHVPVLNSWCLFLLIATDPVSDEGDMQPPILHPAYPHPQFPFDPFQPQYIESLQPTALPLSTPSQKASPLHRPLYPEIVKGASFRESLVCPLAPLQLLLITFPTPTQQFPGDLFRHLSLQISNMPSVERFRFAVVYSPATQRICPIGTLVSFDPIIWSVRVGRHFRPRLDNLEFDLERSGERKTQTLSLFSHVNTNAQIVHTIVHDPSSFGRCAMKVQHQDHRFLEARQLCEHFEGPFGVRSLESYVDTELLQVGIACTYASNVDRSRCEERRAETTGCKSKACRV